LRLKLLIHALLIFSLLGCTVAGSLNHFNNSALNRAAFDLDCESENLKVTPLGSGTYGVTGCGKKSVYVLVGSKYFRNSEITGE
jgi:hypothetical protein